jgi:hypothetical protein
MKKKNTYTEEKINAWNREGSKRNDDVGQPGSHTFILVMILPPKAEAERRQEMMTQVSVIDK